MHPAEIKAGLALKGFKQKAIAVECGVEANTVSAVVNGRSRSAQVERKIAEVMGVDPAALWPQWYGATGADQSVLVSREELLLLRSYRELVREDRARTLAFVQALEAGIAPTGSVVISGGRVAGRDMHKIIIGRDKGSPGDTKDPKKKK